MPIVALLLLVSACSPVKRPVPLDQLRTDVNPDVTPAGLMGEIARAWQSGTGRALRAQPLLAGPALVVPTANGEVYAIQRTDGERFWRRSFGKAPIAGVTSAGQRLFLAGADEDGRAYGIALRDGAVIWERQLGGARHAPAVSGDTVFVAGDGGALHALDAATGREHWRAAVPAAAASPIPHRDAVFLATRAGELLRLDRRTGEVSGETSLPAAVSASPVTVDELLILPLYSGELVAYDAALDATRWTASLGASILAAPVIGPTGEIFVLTRAGDVWRVALGTGAAERIARAGSAARGSLTLVASGLLVGLLDGTLLMITTDGKEVWREELDDSIVAPVAVADGAIFVPLLRGTIVKLREQE